ncbi:MAG: hypothetical protein ACOCT0_03095 [Halobacteriota archaeon]
MTEKQTGKTDKRKMAGAMAFASVLLVVLIISVFTAGMVGAALGVGMGGFVAQFGEVEANATSEIVPTVGQNPACADAPQVTAGVDGTADIWEYVAFHKDLPLPTDGNFGNAEMARVSIVSDGIDEADAIPIEDLDMSLSALEAEELIMGEGGQGDVEVTENAYDTSGGSVDNSTTDAAYANTSQGIGDRADSAEFAITGNYMSITNGTAAAHGIEFGQLELPNVDLMVSMGEEGDFNNSEEMGPTQRVIQPDERTCESLADASAPSNFEGDYPGTYN